MPLEHKAGIASGRAHLPGHIISQIRETGGNSLPVPTAPAGSSSGTMHPARAGGRCPRQGSPATDPPAWGSDTSRTGRRRVRAAPCSHPRSLPQRRGADGTVGCGEEGIGNFPSTHREDGEKRIRQAVRGLIGALDEDGRTEIGRCGEAVVTAHRTDCHIRFKAGEKRPSRIARIAGGEHNGVIDVRLRLPLRADGKIQADTVFRGLRPRTAVRRRTRWRSSPARAAGRADHRCGR